MDGHGTEPTARPESVGLSAERLARLDAHLRRRYVEPGKIAGALALVFRRGEIAWRSVLGSMDLERGKPMRDDAIFRIYSMTKPIVSVALMTLYEEGHFRLADPVHRFLPAFRDLRVFAGGNHPRFLTRPAERPMTVGDLLTHTSGLTYGFLERTNVDAAYRKLGVGDRKPGATLAEMVEVLATLPLEFSPGRAWNYSVATDVVGHLVECISGRPLDRFLAERIFEPLGMVDTGFAVPAALLPRFAACYARTASRRLVLEDDPERSLWAREVTFFSGGGGLVSTAADYLRFARMLLGGGALDGARILSRKTLELMTRNHLPGGADLATLARGGFAETPYEGVGFGLGFSVLLDPVLQGAGSPGEFAWGGAASTVFFVDPREELIVIFLTQLLPSTTYDFRGQLKALVYGALDDAAPARA